MSRELARESGRLAIVDPRWLWKIGGAFLVCLAVVLVIEPGGGGTPGWAWRLIAGAIGLWGLGALAYRRGVVLDRAAGEVTEWWGLLVAIESRRYPLAEFHSVTVGLLWRTSPLGGHAAYQSLGVVLTGPGRLVVLRRGLLPHQAWRLGQRVAQFLSVELIDRTLGVPLSRRGADADKSLRQRARLSGERPPLPDPPADARCRTTLAGDGVTIDIPPCRWRPVDWRDLGRWPLFGLAAAGVVWIPALLITGEALWCRITLSALAIFAFAVAPTFFILAALAYEARHRTTVRALPDALVVERRLFLMLWRTRVAADELEALDLVGPGHFVGWPETMWRSPPSPVLVASFRGSHLVFGRGIPLAELEWLRAVIWNVVTA